MRSGRASLRGLATMALLAILGVPMARQGYAVPQEPSGRYRVLVVPMESSALDRKFGEKVAKEIRERLADFPTHAPVPEKDYKRALKQYDLEEEELDRIRARQLANLMGAQVVFFGTVQNSGSAYEAQGEFIDVNTGDEFAVPPVRIPDRSNQSVSTVVEATIAAFQEQVRFVRARQFCAEYVENQAPEDALRNCDDALGINPNSVNVLFNKGMAYRIMFEREESSTDGWADSAIYFFEAVLSRQASHRAAIQNAAYMYSKIDNADRASELYRRYLEFDPGNVQVRLTVAYDMAQAGLLKEAVEIIQAGLEHTDNDPDLLQYLGDYALRYSSEDSSYVDVALRAYERVLDIKGEETDSTVIHNAIAAMTMANRTQQAIEFAEQALQTQSDSPRLWALYADALARQERFRQAAGAMDTVIALEPNYPRSYQKRGGFKIQAGDVESGLADFRLAIESGQATREEVYLFFFGRAINAREGGDLVGALPHFEHASDFAPRNRRPEVEFWWGYTHYQLGERQADREDASVSQLRRARANFQSAQGHFENSGNFHRQTPQLLQATEQWLLRIDALIRRAQRN